MYTQKDIFLIWLLWTPLVALSYFLNSSIGVFEMILSMILYFMIWYIIKIIWYKIRKKDTPDVITTWIAFLKSIGCISIITVWIIGSFAYYQNEVSPASMPEYTLSNGEKTIIFQTMSHIGSVWFYETVWNNLTLAKQKGFVYFYEWVRPGTVENTQWFNDAIGIQFDAELYKNFSKLYGVVAQDNSKYFGLINNQDYNIDLSIDDIMKEYNKTAAPITESTAPPIDINTEIISILSELRENELKILRYINRSILNFMIKNDRIQELITDTFANPKLFAIILDDRNHVLSQAIESSEHNKIYITYGLLHFDGVLELLQNNDPNWKIISTQYLYPIQ